MIEGELYQLTKNGDAAITEEEHFDIMRRKTAYLFAGCARIGGMLGPGTNTEQEDALWDYGLNIGTAFQLVDDLPALHVQRLGDRRRGLGARHAFAQQPLGARAEQSLDAIIERRMVVKPGKFEIVVDGGADAHMGKLLGVALRDGAAAPADLEQRSPDAVRVAGELHRGCIGEELALARDHRLDQPACQHAYRTDQPQQQTEEEHADVRSRPAHVVAVADARHQEGPDRPDHHDSGDHAEEVDIETHVAVQDVAELVRHDPLQLVPVELLQGPQRHDDRRRLEIDRHRAAMAAQRRGEDSGRQRRNHAVEVRDAGAHGDQREHVEIARDRRSPAAHEEGPSGPQHHGRRESELNPA